MSMYGELQAANEKIDSLKETIQFLCNTMTNAADQIDAEPGMAILNLREAIDDKRYEHK